MSIYSSLLACKKNGLQGGLLQIDILALILIAILLISSCL